MIGLETRSLLVEDRILKDFDWFVEENYHTYSHTPLLTRDEMFTKLKP